MESVILASASPRRKELLEQIGISFRCHPAKGEEKADGTTPEEIVKRLAQQKAEEVASHYQEGIVLGADTIVCCDHEILGKPENRRQAAEMITRLQGRVHEVYTGVCLLHMHSGICGRELIFAEKTEVEFYPMDQEEIERYIRSGEGDDKAGAYGIQGGCAKYIKGIRGDYYNVVGLPISRVYQSLKQMKAGES